MIYEREGIENLITMHYSTTANPSYQSNFDEENYFSTKLKPLDGLSPTYRDAL
jgi:hypothetical protein